MAVGNPMVPQQTAPLGPKGLFVREHSDRQVFTEHSLK